MEDLGVDGKIKIDVERSGRGVDCLVEERNWWPSMHRTQVSPWLAENLLASQKGICSVSSVAPTRNHFLYFRYPPIFETRMGIAPTTGACT